jgi:hypothetical protein
VKVSVRFDGPRTPAMRELLARLQARIDANARERETQRRWPVPSTSQNDDGSKR